MASQASISALKPHFLFPLADPQARRHLLLGSVLMLAGFLIPIVPTLSALGYAVRVMRRTIAGGPPSMQPWDDWGGLLKEGFRFFAVGFCYTLPGTAALMAGFIAYLAAYIPAMISLEAATTPEAEAVSVMVLMLAIAVLFLAMAVGLLLLVGLSIPLPAAVAHVAARGSLAAGFWFREVWRMWRANALGFLIAWVVMVGLYGVVNLAVSLAYATVILLCLLPLIWAALLFYTSLVCTVS